MKVTYDQEVDVLRILFSNAAIEESDEDKPGVILDYDARGNVVGIEILDASKRQSQEKDIQQDPVADANAFFERPKPLESFANTEPEAYVRKLRNSRRLLQSKK
jgi:uncharacterized protein YuzE